MAQKTLYEVLLRYGRHDRRCEKSSLLRALPHEQRAMKCTCGLDEQLEKYKPTNDKESA